MKITRILLGFVLVLLTFAAQAQREPGQIIEELQKLAWQRAPGDGTIGAKAKIRIPEGYSFLDERNTRRCLELMGNPPRDNHYLIAPSNLDWFAVFSFDPVEKGSMHVNYTSRLLGRSGVMSAVLVSSPQTLNDDMKAFNGALASYQFNAGEQYAEFKSGDKIAEYGLAALVVGGAAAAAAKAGLFKSLGKFLWVIGGGAAMAGWALFTTRSAARRWRCSIP